MKLIFFLVALIAQAMASTEAIHSLGRDGLHQFLAFSKESKNQIDFYSAKVMSGLDSEKYYLSVNSSKYYVYDIDINNDGDREYVVVYVGEGSASTSGIYQVVPKIKSPSKENLNKYDYSKIVSKSLWNDLSGDLSKFHLWLADPAFIKRKKKLIIRYMDIKPQVKIFEYIWEKDSFKKL